jgi:hypothetical protein
VYETILHCPKCGHEQRLVAENVVAERDRLREFAQYVATMDVLNSSERQTVTLQSLIDEAKDALGGLT